jgi:hypothetical protein
MTVLGTVSARVQILFNLATAYTALESPGTGGATINRAAFNKSLTLGALSVPPAAAVYGEELTSSQTLDLTALVRSLEAVLDATGLKLQAILINNISLANSVVLADAGANTYLVNAGEPLTIPADSVLALAFNDTLADVDTTHKVLTFTATSGQKYQVALVLG